MSSRRFPARQPADRRPLTPEPSELLGRDEECRAIDDLIAQVRDGLSGVLVVSGEAGIGKTRLLKYAAEAAADLQTARVTGVETESQLGYAALHRLLLPYLKRLDRLPGPAARGTRLGVRTDRGPACRPLPDRPGHPHPAVGGRPGRAAMCFVDDAQWLDRESLEALAFMGRRLHADGIGLVLCVRDGASGASPIDGLPTIRLTGLSDADAARLLASVPVAPSAIDAENPIGISQPGADHPAAASPVALRNATVISRIIADTGGNPLALREFAGNVAGGALPATPLPLGPRLEAHFQRQVDSLPQETKSLLLVLSVAPSDEPVVLWRAAATLGLSAQALDAAVASGIITAHPRPAFRHPLIRSAVHSGASAAELRRVHEAFAAATDRGLAPDRRAWHLAEAVVGLDEEVARELEWAAERARGRGGYAAQATFLVRAAELTPDPSIPILHYRWVTEAAKSGQSPQELL